MPRVGKRLPQSAAGGFSVGQDRPRCGPVAWRGKEAPACTRKQEVFKQQGLTAAVGLPLQVWAVPTTMMQCEWLGERVATVDVDRWGLWGQQRNKTTSHAGHAAVAC